ncbi:MAG: VOC family protein [Micrococcales bacterium]
MNLRQVAQRATDLDRAVAFYTELLNRPATAVFGPLAFFALGPTRLLLDLNAPSSLIYLGVEHVPDTVEKLRAQGIKVLQEPHVIFNDDTGTFDTPGNEWLAFIEDSEGNMVGLMSREVLS